MSNTVRCVALSGCYLCREVLDRVGGRFNAASKEWILTEDQFRAADLAIEGMRTATGKAKRALVKAWDDASGRWFDATIIEADPAMVHAADVRATAMTGGKDDLTYEAVRKGYLSESDAMNTDD